MKSLLRTGINRLAVLVAMAAALAGLSIAHSGFDHVRGTVVSVEHSVLTVKTSTGNVTVKLDGQTQFTNNGKKAQISDLAAGARVIVEVPKGKEKAAQSVKIGVVPPPSSPGKQSGKK